MDRGRPPSAKILFFTNSDYGQANVVLATAYELLRSTRDIEIHIASFPALEQAIEATNRLVADDCGDCPAKQLVYHKLHGRSQFEAATGPDVNIFEAYDRPVGFFNAAHTILCIEGIMQPWTPEEFDSLYQQTVAIANVVGPGLTVVEPLFTPGLTACHHTGLKWIVLSPNTIKDFAVPIQPRLAGLWKYPIVCSGLPFPLPASQIPMNIGLNLVAGYMLLTGQRIQNAEKYLQERHGEKISLMTANDLGVLRAAPPGLRILVANDATLDYPFDVLPPHIVPCGPIVRASQDLCAVDLSLSEWLARAPTVYINLGSHLEMDAAEAMEMAAALRSVMDSAEEEGSFAPRKLQVLWKIKWKSGQSGKENNHGEIDTAEDVGRHAVNRILQREIGNDQIRLTNWVTAEPKSVLESGHIICSVNHGGASSFNEALCAGVPQLFLPGWADCYDFANRAELLGIGQWGNKQAKPRWKKNELSEALGNVIIGEYAEKMKIRARELARLYPEAKGRQMAAAVLLEALVADKP